MRLNRRAFSLVEILVVVGIIAVLLAILIPVVGRARAQAQTVTCMSNQRQLITACLAYANENNDLLPFSGFYDDPVPNWCFDGAIGVAEKENAVRHGQLWNYLKSTGVYHCPADTGPWTAGAANYWSSYMINGAASGYAVNGHVGLAVVLFKSNNVLFWEIPMTNPGIDGANDATNFPSEGVCTRHQHGTTVAYLDGRVEVMTADDFNRMCQYGPSPLWCDPTSKDGGRSKGGAFGNPIPMAP